MRVETEETEGANYLNVYIPCETDTDKEMLYCVSIDDWGDRKLNKFVHMIACLTAEEAPARILENVDIARFSKDLLGVENVFVYVYEENKNKVQMYVGEYYKCHNRILFHIVG